jgi:hypothetical protein
MVGFQTYADAAPSVASDRRQEAWDKLVAEKIDELHEQLSTPEGVRKLNWDREPDWSAVIAAVERGCPQQDIYQELHNVIEPIATALAEKEWE